MNFMVVQTRFYIIIFALGLLIVAGCKTASDSTSKIGYVFTVEAGDTLDAIVKAYREQGVDVTVDQIKAANPGLSSSTTLKAGAKLFIPDKRLVAPHLFQPRRFADFTVALI